MTTSILEETVDLILGEEPHLRSLARSLARCESDADDLVQEALLRAYDARDRFQPGTSIRAWTTTILRRLHITGAVRAKRRRLHTDTDAGGALDSAVGRNVSWPDDPAPNVRALADGLDDTVKRALERVPEVYLTSFFLSAVRDMSCEEIGRHLRVPVGTVMSRVHRARERLRGDLAPHRRMLVGARRATPTDCRRTGGAMLAAAGAGAPAARAIA